jgi:cell division protein FtsL
MARTSTKRKNTKNSITHKIFHKFINIEVFPFVVAFTALGIMYVLIRMKGIEQDYRAHELNNKIKEVTVENKELKADKARLLSVKNLKRMSSQFKLTEPEEKQIIIIPE